MVPTAPSVLTPGVATPVRPPSDRRRFARAVALLGALSLILGVTSSLHAQDARPITQAQKDALVPPPDPNEPRQSCSGNALNLLYPFDRLNTAGWTLSMPRNDDGSSALINLSFTFQFYGVNYTSCFINNNGNITFGAAYFPYVPTGFPSATVPPMIAPFWADVDTRNVATGTVWHKLVDSNGDGFIDTLVVVWDNVGYFNQHADLLNTFELVISDGTNPSLSGNVCFDYDNMCWTTGDINGVGGFTNPPSPTVGNATVGINRGDGVGYFQIGRFGVNSNVYDGPFGNADGISYLDGRRFCFATGSTNIPPIPANFPVSGVITLFAGETLSRTVHFLSPEFGQTTTITAVADPNGAQGRGLNIVLTAGNVADAALTWATGCNDVGTYLLTFTARDNFVPNGVTNQNLIINVAQPFIGPACDISSPTTFSGVCTSVPIIGTANDATGHFSNYALQYATDAHGPWTTFATSNVGVTNGILGVWNTAGLSGGYYMVRVVASNICGPGNSFTTTLVKCTAPVITQQPINENVVETGRICLRVGAGASCGVAFQWRRNGVPLVNGPRISGVNTDELIIDPTVLADTGNYTVVCSNSCGSVTSAVGVVSIRCRSDFNGDGVTNSQDFFDFLTFFFGTCP